MNNQLCLSPLPIRQNIIKNLNKYELDDLCLSSKICHQNICVKNEIWNFLSKTRFGTLPPEGVNARKFYYDQTLNLYGSGDNSYFQLGQIEDNYIDHPILIMNKVIYISNHKYHTGFITFNNDLYMMGSNNKGRLGLGQNKYDYAPTIVLKDIRKVICTPDATFALSIDNNLYQTGISSIIYSNHFSLILYDVKNIYSIISYLENKVTILTMNNYFLTNAHPPNITFGDFELSFVHTDVDDFPLNFNSISENIKWTLYKVLVVIDNINYSNKIKHITFNHSSKKSSREVLLTDNTLIYYYANKYSEIIPNVSIYAQNDNYFVWIDNNNLFTSYNHNNQSKYTKILDFKVVRMKSPYDDMNLVYILSYNGHLHKINLENNESQHITSNVYDFDINKANEFYITGVDKK